MTDESRNNSIPPGIMLRHTLRGHSNVITQLAWAQDSMTIASSSSDGTVRLWDVQTGQVLQTLESHSNWFYGVAWSPDRKVIASCSDNNIVWLWDTHTGQSLRTLEGHSDAVNSVAWSSDGILASSAQDGTIYLWNPTTGESLRALRGHSDAVNCLTWSPDGRVLASCSDDRTIHLWNSTTEQFLRTLTGHSGAVYSLAWSPDGRTLASCSRDETIRLWNPITGQQTDILEGHTNQVTSISFSYDGRLLVSKSNDETVRIWRVDSWETITILKELSSNYWFSGLAFHPSAPILGTLGEQDTAIRIWELDVAALFRSSPFTPSVHYTNAKVVLVGDSGVGKSGLGLVLSNQSFVPTESTHGRRVWNFGNQEVIINGGSKSARETLLWDLAGQPGYRLIHQLHLNEVTVALIVFDSHSETDPFAGVSHWARALSMVQHAQGDAALPMKKFLVAARIDRIGKGVSRERINTLVQKLSFDGYFETSAKEGQNIAELAEAIKKAIDWDMLPRVRSSNLFQVIKTFLITEKEAGRLLSTCDELYRTFLRSERTLRATNDLQAQFETCIGRVESQGLLRRLSFGNLVLLQPELLDAYASALINAVREEPDGLGSVIEDKARAGDFSVPKDERLLDREQEKLLLIAMVEDMLRYEIALRESGSDGTYLVFPSQSTRENTNLPDPEGKTIIFSFEGPVLNVYATLAVRLSHSGLFIKKELWKNAVIYTTKVGGTYGMFLNNFGEGYAELILFFDANTSEEMRFHFEEYIKTHLQRRAIPDTIQRRRIFVCPECVTPLDDLHVTKRRKRGFDWIRCSVCDTRIALVDGEERLTLAHTSLISQMDRAANIQREREVANSIIQGRSEIGDFDVFLCHNGKNKAEVKKIGEELKERGFLPWLDEWELPPGKSWQRLLQKQVKQIRSVAVFVGKDGVGPWQQEELEAILSEFVKKERPIIPVLLSDAPRIPKIPIFLKNRTWVDFRKQVPDPFIQLIWGITGKRDVERYGVLKNPSDEL